MEQSVQPWATLQKVPSANHTKTKHFFFIVGLISFFLAHITSFNFLSKFILMFFNPRLFKTVKITVKQCAFQSCYGFKSYIAGTKIFSLTMSNETILIELSTLKICFY